MRKARSISARRDIRRLPDCLSAMSKQVLPAIQASEPTSSVLREFHRSLKAVISQAHRKQCQMERRNGDLGQFSCKKSQIFHSSFTSDRHQEEERAPHNSPSDLTNLTDLLTLYPPVKSMAFPHYKQRFDDMVVEIVSSLDCLEDASIRLQFEFLLAEFRNTLLIDGEDQQARPHHQFLDAVRSWLQGLDTEQSNPAMDEDAVQVINVSAAIKLQEARDLQRQVEKIQNYLTHATRASSKHQGSWLGQFRGQPTVQPLHQRQGDVSKECWADSSRSCLRSRGLIAQADPADLDLLLSQMHILSYTVETRERRMAAFTKSNALLTHQIGEVGNTLADSSGYLDMIRRDEPTALSSTTRKQMCSFQESMIETIVKCIETLHNQIDSLPKQDEALHQRTSKVLTNHVKLRKDDTTMDAQLTTETAREEHKDHSDKHREYDSPPCSNADLFVVMKAITNGVDIFQKTCREIWEEALSRVLEESEVLLRYRKKMTPQAEMATNVRKLKLLAKEDWKYFEPALSGIRLLATIARDLSHLMILTRLKDLQLVSIDHKIGMMYLSFRGGAASKSEASDRGVAKPKQQQKLAELNPYPNKQTKARLTLSHIAVTKAGNSMTSITSSSHKICPHKTQTSCSALNHQQPTNSHQQNCDTNGNLGSGTINKCRDDMNEFDEVKSVRTKNTPTHGMHMATAAELKFPLDFCYKSTGPFSASNASQLEPQVISPWVTHYRNTAPQKTLEHLSTMNTEHREASNDRKGPTLPRTASGTVALKRGLMKTAPGIDKFRNHSVPRINVTFDMQVPPPNRQVTSGSLPLIGRKSQSAVKHRAVTKPK